MLRHWEHPLASDDLFRNAVLESIAVVLRQAADGAGFGEMPPMEVNLVFSVGYPSNGPYQVTTGTSSHQDSSCRKIDPPSQTMWANG
jgi:hypothetical protein